MRVGLVCPYSMTLPGGVQGQVLGIARALRKLGHSAHVLAPCDGPPPDANVIPLGKSIPTAANGSVAPIAPDLSAALRTVRVLRNERFDVLHIHEPMVPGPSLTSLLFSDLPKIGTFHRFGVAKHYEKVHPFFKAWINRLDVRIAVSNDAKHAAEIMYTGDYEVLFNGVEVDRFATADPYPTEKPTIFFLGRHEHRKGLSVLLDALSRLPDDLAVWVAGDGPETDELKTKFVSESRIEWLGRISDIEVTQRLRGANVFCAPSLDGESFGVVLAEAMAAGVPVVASNLPGYRNVATDGLDAILVNPDDPSALAEALWKVLSNTSIAKSLAENGGARARELDMTHLAERYVEYFERLVSPR